MKNNPVVLIFGREPVYWLTLVAVVVKLFTAFGLHISSDAQTAVNAIAAGVVAIVTAVVLRNGALGAAILQVAQALLALFIGLHFNLSAESQAEIMSTLAAVLALILHQQVQAPVAQHTLEKSSPVEKTATRRAVHKDE